MLEKGSIFSINPDDPKHYVVLDRIDDMARGEGGWLCVELNTYYNKEKLDSFDFWRISDRYFEIQKQRGVIQVVDHMK